MTGTLPKPPALGWSNQTLLCPAKIGPPVVSLTGCDQCLRSDIILPEADSSSRVNIHDFYNPIYRITVRKRGEQVSAAAAAAQWQRPWSGGRVTGAFFECSGLSSRWRPTSGTTRC